jgi:acyl-CoA synthetase (NDP forming)
MSATPPMPRRGRALAKLSTQLLVEEMITDGVAEILIGVIVDPQFGQVLVLGAGGVFTEIWPTASACCRRGRAHPSHRR